MFNFHPFSKKSGLHSKNLDVWECLFFTLYAVFGTDALVSRNSIHAAAYVCVFMTAVAGIYLALNIKYFSKIKFYILLVLSFLSLLSGMQNNDFGYGYILFLCVLIFATILSEIIKFDYFINLYSKVIFGIAVFSLFCFFFAFIIIKFAPGFLYYTNTSGLRFIVLWVTNINLNDSSRNFGAFWEPGAFQFYLNVALMFELFFRKQKARIWFVLAFVAAVATTFSTTGYIVTMLLLVTALISKWKQFEKSTKNRFIAGGAALALAAVLFWATIADRVFNDITITTPVIGKFLVSEDAKTDQDTVNNRVYSLLSDFEVIKNSPLLGKGRTNAYELALKYGQLKGMAFVHNTNTYAIYGANFGVIFMLIIIIQYILFFLKRIQRKWLAILLFLIFSVILFAEDFTGSLLIFVLFFYSFGKTPQENEEKALAEGETNEQIS